MKKNFNRIIIKILVYLHNFSYKHIGKLSITEQGGLHPKHKLMNYHQFFLDNLTKKDNVLDIGCGNGYVSYQVSRKVNKVVGVDISENNINKAKFMHSANNIDFIIGDATTYRFNKSFTVIILSNVLEHIDNRVAMLKKCRPLAPKLLLRVPMINRDWIVLYKKQLGLEYRLDSTHFTEYTISQLEQETKKSGWKIVSYSVQFGECWAVLRSTEKS